MKHFSTALCSLVSVLLLFLGCTPNMEDADSAATDAGVAMNYTLEEGMILGAFPEHLGSEYSDIGHPDHKDVVGEAVTEAFLHMARANKMLKAGDPLSDVEVVAREAFASKSELSEPARWVLGASLGAKMLTAHLNADSPDSEALGFYTQSLVDQKSSNGPLLASALTALEDDWSATKIAAARLSTASAVEDALIARNGPLPSGAPLFLSDIDKSLMASAQSMREKARVETER